MNDFQARAPPWRKLFGYEFVDESSEILNLDSTVRNDFILPLSTCATNFESTLFFAIKCQFSVSILPPKSTSIPKQRNARGKFFHKNSKANYLNHPYSRTLLKLQNLLD